MKRPDVEPVVLGIDPRLDGAVAVLSSDGTLRVHPTTTDSARSGARRDYPITAMKTLLTARPVTLAVMESVGAWPGRGVTGAFRYGCGYGSWMALLNALDVPFMLFTPHAWKRQILRGTAGDTAAAVRFVRARFPGVSLPPSARAGGPARAACLAETARRLLDEIRSDVGSTPWSREAPPSGRPGPADRPYPHR